MVYFSPHLSLVFCKICNYLIAYLDKSQITIGMRISVDLRGVFLFHNTNDMFAPGGGNRIFLV